MTSFKLFGGMVLSENKLTTLILNPLFMDDLAPKCMFPDSWKAMIEMCAQSVSRDQMMFESSVIK